MRKRIDGEDRAGPGHLEHLQDKQADRPAAKHRNGLEKSGLRKVDRVDGDPERLEHHDVGGEKLCGTGTISSRSTQMRSVIAP